MKCPPELAAGELLPEQELKRWLRFCGRGVRVFKGCRLVPADRISIGDFSQIDEAVKVFAGEGVEIGRYVHLAVGTSLTGGGTCKIGDFAGIAAGVRIITGTEMLEGGLSNPTVPSEFRKVLRSRVSIGAHALVFTNSIVLPGVTIGEGAVASAGAVVHHDLSPWTIYAGLPLVRVGTRERTSVAERARCLLMDH